MREQFVVVDKQTGLPVQNAQGHDIVIVLPVGLYTLEWKEIPVAQPLDPDAV